MANTLPVGGDFAAALMQYLAALGPQMAIQYPQSQASIMGSTGYINPWALGNTDPQATRRSMGGVPTLMREKGTAPVYYLDPTTGQVRHVADQNTFALSGFDWGDVREVDPGYINQTYQGQIGDPIRGAFTDWQKPVPTLEQAQFEYQKAIRGLKPAGARPTQGTISQGF